LLLLLHTTPEEASFLMIWVGLSAFIGRITCAWLADVMGRRGSGIFACLGGVVALICAGYMGNLMIGSVSVFWLMLMAHSFFGGGAYAIIAPYMAEVWPAGLRASGMGLGYGVGNLGKIISPLGLALIVGGGFRQAGGQRQRDCASDVLPCLLGSVGGGGVLDPRHRDQGRSIEEIDARSPRPIKMSAG
jgi:MFS family permease